MIRCFIVLPVSERIWQILLLYPAARIIVGILISLPMSQSGSALIMGIAEPGRDISTAAMTDILQGMIDSHAGTIALGCAGHVNDSFR